MFFFASKTSMNETKTKMKTAKTQSKPAAPVATNDSYTTSEDTALTVVTPGVLANDTDANSDALNIIVRPADFGSIQGTVTTAAVVPELLNHSNPAKIIVCRGFVAR